MPTTGFRSVIYSKIAMIQSYSPALDSLSCEQIYTANSFPCGSRGIFGCGYLQRSDTVLKEKTQLYCSPRVTNASQALAKDSSNIQSGCSSKTVFVKASLDSFEQVLLDISRIASSQAPFAIDMTSFDKIYQGSVELFVFADCLVDTIDFTNRVKETIGEEKLRYVIH